MAINALTMPTALTQHGLVSTEPQQQPGNTLPMRSLQLLLLFINLLKCRAWLEKKKTFKNVVSAFSCVNGSTVNVNGLLLINQTHCGHMTERRHFNNT